MSLPRWKNSFAANFYICDGSIRVLLFCFIFSIAVVCVGYMEY